MAGGCAGVSAGRLGVAYACVIGAGVASVLGGLFIVLVPVRSKLFLAASLAFAAGVMLYISLVDIYAGKAVGHFVEAGYSEAHAFTYASICVFCGFPISWVLDKVADRLSGGSHECPACPAPAAPPPALPLAGLPDKANPEPGISEPLSAEQQQGRGTDIESGSESGGPQQPAKQDSAGSSSDDDKGVKGVHSRKLVHMGILAAMAVALHNMPEGLVTFVGYMDSISSGLTTAVAITVHNIPEGMVIASAVYFGTGLRCRALAWASVAAITEPLGGLIGLAVVCGGSMTPTVFGILFGLVAGIMTYISLKELLPGARTFDPDDCVTTAFLTAGMIVMACSLVAIAFSTPSTTAAAGAGLVVSGVLPPSSPSPSPPPLQSP